MTALLGTLASKTASLTLAVFDARAATAWVPTKAAENKAQFTGHPAEILRALAKGEELAPIDVGPSSGVAFELESASGRIDVYRIDAGLVFVGPPRAWFADEVDAAFAELLAAADDANELGELEIESGRLAAVYMWLPDVKLAADLAVPPGGAARFGDDGGLVIELEPGRYRVLRHEVDAAGRALVGLFVVRE